MDRLSVLRSVAATRPEDPFPSYGLAMELLKQGCAEDALSAFATLVVRHPNYLATYLMYGNLLRDQGRAAEAQEIYRSGIKVAQRAGDTHAASELDAALAELL